MVSRRWIRPSRLLMHSWRSNGWQHSSTSWALQPNGVQQLWSSPAASRERRTTEESSVSCDLGRAGKFSHVAVLTGFSSSLASRRVIEDLGDVLQDQRESTESFSVGHRAISSHS